METPPSSGKRTRAQYLAEKLLHFVRSSSSSHSLKNARLIDGAPPRVIQNAKDTSTTVVSFDLPLIAITEPVSPHDDSSPPIMTLHHPLAVPLLRQSKQYLIFISKQTRLQQKVSPTTSPLHPLVAAYIEPLIANINVLKNLGVGVDANASTTSDFEDEQYASKHRNCKSIAPTSVYTSDKINQQAPIPIDDDVANTGDQRDSVPASIHNASSAPEDNLPEDNPPEEAEGYEPRCGSRPIAPGGQELAAIGCWPATGGGSGPTCCHWWCCLGGNRRTVAANWKRRAQGSRRLKLKIVYRESSRRRASRLLNDLNRVWAWKKLCIWKAPNCLRNTEHWKNENPFFILHIGQ
ncbi:hypothetical protein H6P81_015877 [Aristolochia fimbriata]|uniref:Uncharacterized protein n=1 Tax=Aristolochia fimbriata TaxID=158543 RepID=A0AAV7EAI7_ARIFI|nr:hypothetical protein H6P81_015877 [Aristolochia fimbriata]